MSLSFFHVFLRGKRCLNEEVWIHGLDATESIKNVFDLVSRLFFL